MFKQMAFFVPNGEKERIAIGNFFRNFDDLIALKKQQQEQSYNIKKSMLEKLLPKNGTDVPEVRFDGFSGAWEQKTLGDIAESLEYGLNAAATKYDGKNKYLRITDIDEISNEFLNTDLTTPETNLDTADSYLLRSGDILFARTGASVGKTYRYKISDGKVFFAGFLIRARIKDEYDCEFVFQNTLTENYKRFIYLTSQRSGQPGVNAQEYSGFEIMMPCKDEQTVIGGFFRNLDTLIESQREELEKLQNIKKACFSKMFV